MTITCGATEAEKWHVDPYTAAIENGRVYGKGSVDDKAPLAAMMRAVIQAAQQADKLHGTLVLVAAAEEETGGTLGTRWLAQSAHLPQCDFIVVGEQTHNRVAVAHKGVIRARVQTIGRAVHATNPDRGINAIMAMARIILVLEQYHRDLTLRMHPIVGVPTCNVGVIKGGSTANTVPDDCQIYLDRRMIPGENPAEVRQEICDVVAAVDVSPAQVIVDEFLVSDWFNSTIVSPLAQQFMACVQAELQASPGPVGYLPGSDAKHLTGVCRGEMVIFGPGTYEIAHAYDEYVEIEAVEAIARILDRFVEQTLLNGK